MRTNYAAGRPQRLCLALGCLLTTIAAAQTPRASSVEQLQAELERRDAIIADLLQRVQVLEGRMGTAPAPAQATAAPRVATAPPPSRARAPVDEAAEEALLERALERSLVLSGGALLPRGAKEIEPSLAYDYTQRSGVAFVGDGAVFRSFRKENYGAALAFRAGLPWSSQIDIAVPFAHQRVEAVVDGIPLNSSDSGVGDVQVALSHQFLDERTRKFALLGSLGWVHSHDNAVLRPLATGAPDFLSPAAIGAGQDSLVARLTATKRMDPLVFVGSLSHTWNRGDTVSGIDVKTGAVNGATLRAILAVSPDVSVRSGISVARASKTRVNGFALEGTASTASLLELGTSVVLSRNMLFDLAIGIGLTGESPDFTLGVSLPIRF